MREFLFRATEVTVVAVDTLALLVVVAATVQVLANGARALLTSTSEPARRMVWVHYARWLVVALTFQLAADIVETSIRSDWQSIARLGAVAVIRTFLNYFLERDLGEVRLLGKESAA